MNSPTMFWVVAVAFVAVALAFLLPPLLRRGQGAVKTGRRSINIAVYRDQMKEMEVDRHNDLLTDDQFASAKLELEARLAQDAIDSGEEIQPVRRGGRVLGFTLAGLVPVVAFGLYSVLGNPQAITAIASANAGMARAQAGHDIQEMLQKIENKTRENPNDGEAWAMLARTYSITDRWPDAIKAYEKAMALTPNVPALMTAYAEALAITNNRSLAGQPMALVSKALAIDPADQKGLELAGIYNFQEKHYAQAADMFGRLHKRLPPESSYAKDIATAQKEASRLANAGPAALDNLSDMGKAGAAGAVIRGQVDIAPALRSKLNPQDVIFLFARNANGGAPVAVSRVSAGNLPLKFELSDAMAMTPDNRLSNFKEVTVMARVSKSGDVVAAAGDLEGSLDHVKVGTSNVRLVIDKVLN